MTEQKSRKLTLKRGAETTTEAPRLEERLHKVLAQAGLGSRRALEQRIADGLVKVNGEVAQVGMSVKSGDKIVRVNGEAVTSLMELFPALSGENEKAKVVVLRDGKEVEIAFQIPPRE